MKSARLLALAIPLLVTGCGTLASTGRRWGEDAIVPLPSLRHIGESFVKASVDPLSWAPATGALVLSIDHFDRRVSHWAITHNPVFGSTTTADNLSNDLVYASGGLAVATTLATPSGEEAGTWLPSKLRGFAVEAGAFGLTAGVTEGLKVLIRRPRPLGQDFASLPSGHAAAAFSFATMTSRNLDSIEMPEALRFGLQATAYTLAAGAGWARVESGDHFLSDVLIGASIGHFVTAFIHDAFLGVLVGERVSMDLGFSKRRVAVLFRVSF